MKTKKKRRKRKARQSVAAFHLPDPVDVVEVHFPEPLPEDVKPVVEVKGRSLYIRLGDFLRNLAG